LGHGVLFEGLVYELVTPGNPEEGATRVDVNVYQAAPGDTVTSPANPGDPVVKSPDKNINSDDIQQILAEAKFNSGAAADWSQGDFNDDGLCDANDIQLVLGSALFNAGPYTAASPQAATDAKAALRVTPAGLLIDTAGTTINGYVLESSAGVLTGAAADNLGLMQEDNDSRISGQMFFSLNGTHLLGRVVGSEWSGISLAQDLSMTYTVEGRAGIYTASVVVPEPGTVVMLVGGTLLGLLVWWRRRRTT
jgi:hypothetical protein